MMCGRRVGHIPEMATPISNVVESTDPEMPFLHKVCLSANYGRTRLVTCMQITVGNELAQASVLRVISNAILS